MKFWTKQLLILKELNLSFDAGTGAKCLGEHSRSFSGYWPLCWSRCRLVVADRKGLVEVQVFENLNQVHYLIPFE